MKKIIIVTMMAVMAIILSPAVTKAQGSFSQTATNPTGAITNTSVDTMTYTLKHVYLLVSIQPVVTKATGTMAGWAVLDYSVNGTNWNIGTDTLALSNITTNTTVWNKSTASKYFRIRVGGATTVTGTASAKISASQ